MSNSVSNVAAGKPTITVIVPLPKEFTRDRGALLDELERRLPSALDRVFDQAIAYGSLVAAKEDVAISRSHCETDYNHPDLATRRSRYQAIYEVVHTKIIEEDEDNE